jgi:predicted permease
VTQVAVSTMLLIAGGLLLRTFLTMQATEPGFASGPVLTFNLALGERQYPTLSDEVRFYDELLTGLRALPGVQAAGTTTLLPLTRGEFGDGFYRVGFDDVYPNIPIARLQNVTPGYFEAIGLPVKAGRALLRSDVAGALPVVVVNEALERQYFPDGALGQRMRFRGVVAEVVGVVGDKHHRNLRDTPRPEMFYPRAQVTHPRLFSWVAVRTSGDAMALLPSVRTLVATLDAGVALDDPAPMAERVQRVVAPDRFRASLVGALAVVALLLAAIGLYGLIAYAVARDARDIAIRMALGASAGTMVGRVLWSVVLLAGAGITAGVLGAIAGHQWLSSFLTGVTARDPLTISVTALGLMLVALLAAAAPAIRASRIDPASALRSQ